MKNGKKIGIGLGIGGALVAAAGAALALFFGKKKDNVELIDGVDYANPEVVDTEESVEE